MCGQREAEMQGAKGEGDGESVNADFRCRSVQLAILIGIGFGIGIGCCYLRNIHTLARLILFMQVTYCVANFNAIRYM